MPRKVIILSLVLASFVFCPRCRAETTQPRDNTLIIFYSPTCHECIEIKNKLLPIVAKEYAGRINLEERDISVIENYKLLLGLREKFRKGMKIVVPVFYFGGDLINGNQASLKNVRRLIERSHGLHISYPAVPQVELSERFRAFSPLAISAAGLIDGINPCAFTVIVFFISYLALQGYKKKELVLVGLAFILAVFVTYLLLGLGIFNFLYYLEGFWVVAKFINIGIGIFSIILGGAALYDYFRFRRTGSSEGLVLQLPAGIKNRIHYVIGLHYRKPKGADGTKLMQRLVASAFVCGFLVSILEAVCTGQTYLPTISFILKTTSLKVQAFVYLMLYNLMFVAPLGVIFMLALLGVTSEDFSAFLKRHLLTVKLLTALLFFGLGVFLVWRYSG